MRKLFYFLPALLCLWVPGRAQTVEDTISLEAMLDRAFSSVNLAHVPSGIMIDKVPGYVDLAYFRGDPPPDTVYLPGPAFPLMYGMIDRAHTGTSPLVDIEDWWDTFEVHEANDTLKLGLIWYAYDRVREDALDEELLSFSVDRFYDVPARPTHPYAADTVFGTALMRYRISGLTQLIHYDTTLFFSNLAGSAPTLEIDAGDGLGWRSISPGGQLSVTFPSDTVHLVKVRLLSALGRDWYGNTALVHSGSVSSLQGEGPPPGGSRSGGYSTTPDETITTVPGVTLYVFLNKDCPAPALRKPLILIEGFDPGNSNDWNLLTNPNSSGLLDDIYGDSGAKTLKAYIHDGHYDLIYVDFDDGTASIPVNAAYVQAAIAHINGIKATNGSVEKNVVIGASMGGVVGKWALRSMEIEEEDHETEIFITFDSPMRGANIPLGLQAFLRDMNSMKIFGKTPAELDDTGAAAAGWAILNTPAAKQMLYYHIDGCNGEPNCWLNNISSMHANFYGQFLALGDLDIPEYAIVNGAINSSYSEEFGSGAILLEDDVFKHFAVGTGDDYGVPGVHWIKLNTKLWSLPGSSADDYVYHRSYRHVVILVPIISTRHYKVVAGAPQKYDNAPGGLRSFSSGTDEGLKWKHTAFTFIPTISSLSLNTTDPFHTGIDLEDAEDVLESNTLIRGYVGSRAASLQYDVLRTNQAHVSLDAYSARYLRALISKTDMVIGTGGALTDIYNFGKGDVTFEGTLLSFLETPDIVTEDLVVEDGGLLWVNRHGRIGDISQTSNPDNNLGTLFEVRIGKDRCDGDGVTVTIADGGELRVGEDDDPGELNRGHVFILDESALVIEDGGQGIVENESRIIVEDGGRLDVLEGGFLQTEWAARIILREGAEMKVASGATLRISQYSALEIEDGATLHLEDGAIVQLWDGDDPDGLARIVIEGTLVVDGDINFSGNGFFDFYPGHTLTLTGSGFSLTGHDKEYRMIRLADGAQLDIGSKNLTLEDGKVVFEGDADISMGAGSNLTLDNVWMEGDNTLSLGVSLTDHRRVRVRNTDFTDFSSAILIDGTNGTFPVGHTVFAGSNFVGNKTAITLQDLDQAYITDCTFEAVWSQDRGIEYANVDQLVCNGTTFEGLYAGVWALVSSDLSRLVFGGCYFYQNTYGILASDEDNRVNIVARNGTTFEENDYAIYVEEGNLDATKGDHGLVLLDCARLINNDVGVRGKDLLIQIDAYQNSHTDNPTYLRSNIFDCSLSPVQRLFDLCYDVRSYASLSPIPARGNYWDFSLPFAGGARPWRVIDLSVATSVCYAGTAGNILDPFTLTGYVGLMPSSCPSYPSTMVNDAAACVYVPGGLGSPIDIRQRYYNAMAGWRAQLDNDEYDTTASWYDTFGQLAQMSDSIVATLGQNCQQYIRVARTFHPQSGSVLVRPEHPGDAVQDAYTRQEITVFPNPFSGTVHITGVRQKADWRVIDLLGRTLASGEIYAGDATLDLAHLPAGQYIIHLNGDSIASTQSILLQKK